MKNLNITYGEKDFRRLEKLKNKKGLSWENFILWACENVFEEKEENEIK